MLPPPQTHPAVHVYDYAGGATANSSATYLASDADYPRGLSLDRYTTSPGEPIPSANAFLRRVHGWTFQGYPIGMGTGAVYVCLSGIKGHPDFLTPIEVTAFIINLTLFCINTTMLLLQAIIYPRRTWSLISDPVKGVFVPLIVLSVATLIIGTIKYAFPAGYVSAGFVYALFWVYISLAVFVCFPMLMIWFNQPHALETFTPAYMFLIFPMMLTGVVAFNVLSTMDLTTNAAIGVLLIGYFFQGVGFFMTFFYLAIYVLRIMTTGFLDGHQANGAFVACGPPGFTGLALIELGTYTKEILPRHGHVTARVGEIWYAVSVMSALMLYGLAVFFFIMAALPYWFKVHKHLHEILGCWALTFPNVGWISLTGRLSQIFELKGFYIIHAMMSVFIVGTWCILLVMTGIAFWKGLIFSSTDQEVYKDSRASRRERMDDEKRLVSRSNTMV
ncbi:hypothetical protein CYLTODRAFT_434029 [Cylindrobasidium torrendii FP15055 ss-10]|uniref:C4-dicarboxylate transporter/malic acid transport protein n=1 Tax=Cylindrobasidium torrendii FP15055 ss-10 TaxID=1314674 RepID=A0A0D7BT80_9AGAR|nr:hypothetical protein CYLTODRAFT_434029 [Cylindrobasidium torrendii FP15055 ss-10]